MGTKMLAFRYKGWRTYVHGTDMYMEFADLVNETAPGVKDGEVMMTIRQMIKNQCKLVYSTGAGAATRPDGYKTEFSFKSGPVDLTAWLVETEEPLSGKYEYDEDEITRNSTVHGENIRINGDLPYSPIEIIVELNKHLHVTLFPEAPGKWLFTKLELTGLLKDEDSREYNLNFVKNSNFRITKSDIFAGDRKIGSIYFSLLKQ